jgi:hypothetical protein
MSIMRVVWTIIKFLILLAWTLIQIAFWLVMPGLIIGLIIILL